MRNLEKVIDALLKVIPTTETDLIGGLEGIKSSVSFSAPESMGIWWKETAILLHDHIGDATDLTKLSDWQRQVVNIYVGQTDVGAENNRKETT